MKHSTWRALLLALTLGSTMQAVADAGYNLLFLWIDDLGTQRLDYPDAKMPNLDALAERGVTFTQAHAPAPICSASRGAVLSGIPPHISKHGGNAKKEKFRSIKAFKDVTTWPQDLLENHGRDAYTAGKIFHAGADSSSFNYFGPHFGGPERKGRKVFRTKVGVKSSFSTQPVEETNDFITAAYAADVLRQPHDKPFVMMVGIRRPHNPHFVPQEFDLWDIEEINEPPGYLEGDRQDTVGRLGRFGPRMALDRKRGTWPLLIRGYLGAAAFADAAAGVVLDALAAGPSANNTIVIAAGDHGYCLGEKDHATKIVLWDCGSRTELIISAPDGHAGATVDDTVSLMDLQPTVRDLLGLPPRTDIAGQSLATFVSGPGTGFEGFALSTYGKKNHALRAREYTYIRYINGKEELYDRANDPWEHTNLLFGSSSPPEHSMMSEAMDNLLSGAQRPF